MRVKEVAGLFIVIGAFSVGAQERIPAGPPPNGPTFEVVSIKRVTEIRNSRRNGTLPGGKYVIEGMTISPAIREAYQSVRAGHDRASALKHSMQGATA